MDATLARALGDTYELRRQSDYQLDVDFTESDVAAAVESAREFLNAVREMLR